MVTDDGQRCGTTLTADNDLRTSMSADISRSNVKWITLY